MAEKIIDCAIVTLADLELAAALLADPTSALRFKDPQKWERFCRTLADAMRKRHLIRVHTEDADRMPENERWLVPLRDAPQPWRGRIHDALGVVARRHDRDFRPELVEFVC